MHTKSVVGIDELGRIFSGGEWNPNSQLDQYSKSLYVFAAVNKIAMKVASIELRLYKVLNSEGESEELLAHDVLDLLNRFNPYQTRSEFLKTAWINKKLTGEAIWHKVRNSRGEVVELWNIRPDLMTVVADPTEFIKRYELRHPDGKVITFPPEDIIHFRDPSPTNPHKGQSPLEAAKYRIETEQAATKYQRNFFHNNARPDALLVTEEQLDTEQRTQMTESWEEKHRSRGDQVQSSRLGILEGGMKYQQVSISQREMDYIESMKFTRDDILVAFGVPKGVITTDDVNYANAQAAIRMFLSETIAPEMDQLVEVLNEFLLAPDFEDDIFLDYIDPTPSDRDAIRADHEAGFGKWLTTNEIRSEYNLAPIEGGDTIVSDSGTAILTPDATTGEESKRLKRLGLKHLSQRPAVRMKMQLVESLTEEIAADIKLKQARRKASRSKANKTVTKQTTSLMSTERARSDYYFYLNKKLDDKAKSFEEVIVEEMKQQEIRVIQTLTALDNESSKSNEKLAHTDISNIMNKDAEVKIFAKLSLPFLLDFAQQGGEEAAELTDESFDITEDLQRSMDKRAIFFAESITDTTFNKLTSKLSAGINAGEGIAQLTNYVKETYGEIPEWRAKLIARTETTAANNEGMIAQYTASEVITGKEWIATQDDRTRDEHSSINGEIVGVGTTFSNGLMYPQQPNCRCVLAPALFD